MPTFVEDWKKAKTAFQNTTQKKKPSASFLGVFNKGSGISSALESADKAKTAGDLQKAMASFKKAYDEYTKTLEKAIADPKSTPVADKPAYAAAVKKLKEDLEAIVTSAGDTMQKVIDDGATTKTKVDPALMKKYAEGEKAVQQHTAKRLALAKTLATVLSEYKSKGVEAAVANAVKQAQTAKSQKAGGKTMEADVAAGVSAKFAEQAETLLNEIAAAWKEKSTKGEMIELRLDPAFGDVPPEKKAQYQKDAGTAWASTEKVQRDINTYIANLRAEVLKGNTAAEGAEIYMIGKMPPSAYIKRLTEMKSRLETIEGGTLSKYAGKIATVREQQKNWNSKVATTPNLKEGITKQWTQLKAEHEFAVAQASQNLTEMNQMQTRISTIPQDDKGVKEATTATNVVLTRVRKLANDYVTGGNLLIKELTGYMA